MSWAACCSNKQMQDLFFGESNQAMFKAAAAGRREAGCQWCYEHVQVPHAVTLFPGCVAPAPHRRLPQHTRCVRLWPILIVPGLLSCASDVRGGQVAGVDLRQLQGHERGVRKVHAARAASANA